MCTIEISKLVGEPFSHMDALYEWVQNAMMMRKRASIPISKPSKAMAAEIKMSS
jgi:hypothetical protein